MGRNRAAPNVRTGNSSLGVWCRCLTWVLTYGIYIYLATYLLIMEPKIPAVANSPASQPRFYASYRFAPTVQVSPPLSIFLPTTTWWNCVFCPVDVARSAILPPPEPLFGPGVTAKPKHE